MGQYLPAKTYPCAGHMQCKWLDENDKAQIMALPVRLFDRPKYQQQNLLECMFG